VERGIDSLQAQQFHIEDKQNHDFQIREQETGNFTIWFHDICPSYTEGTFEVRRNCGGI
jgi:hypothetical protein